MANDISASVFGQSVSFLTVRLRTIDSPAIIMQRTPSDIPYKNPAELLIARWSISSPGSCGRASPC